MRILLGVTGEGLGHAMRSRVVHDVLVAEGHELLIAASGRAADHLAAAGARVVPIEGFSLRYRDGTLLRARTAGAIVRGAPHAIRENLRASASVDPFGPELVITDFDSFAHLYAKRRGIPLVSVDHHHVLTRCRHDAAVRAQLPGAGWLTRAVVRSKIPGADLYVASAFFAPEVRPRCAVSTRVIGPILRPEVLALRPTRGDHVLVYGTSGDDEGLAEALAGAPNARFRVYGRRPIAAARPNIAYLPFDERSFLDDLASARAVVTNGGHTLLAEAIHLEKPVLSVPIRRHGEQELNAAYLAASGRGLVARRLTARTLGAFLDWVDDGGPRGQPPRAPGNTALVACLAEAIALAEAA